MFFSTHFQPGLKTYTHLYFKEQRESSVQQKRVMNVSARNGPTNMDICFIFEPICLAGLRIRLSG